MPHDGITNKSSGKPSRRRTDWDRVDRMTDEAIRGAAARDPDAHLDDHAFWAQAEVLTPEERHARRTGKIPAGRPSNESARIDIRIEPALKQWADAYARSLGIKVSGLIRMLLSKERQKVESER
jgi:hypothetical protein